MSASAENSGRLYILTTRGDPQGYASYYTGQVGDGRQLLLGWAYDGLIALWFDSRGELLNTEKLTPPAAEVVADGGASQGASLRLLRGWLPQVGYKSASIQVRWFRVWVDDFPIYLKGLPEGLDGTYGAISHAPEQVSETKKTIEEWRAEKNVVFVWGDESFCLNADGSSWD